jgi:Tfp pilus assembly protein PilE
MRLASAEERYFTNFNTYVDLPTLGLEGTSEKKYYTATIEPGNAGQTYVITLDPQAPQDRDACAQLTINNTGFKHQSGTESNGKCW